MFVSCVHPVAVLNASHTEEAYSRASLITALWQPEFCNSVTRDTHMAICVSLFSLYGLCNSVTYCLVEVSARKCFFVVCSICFTYFTICISISVSSFYVKFQRSCSCTE